MSQLAQQVRELKTELAVWKEIAGTHARTINLFIKQLDIREQHALKNRYTFASDLEELRALAKRSKMRAAAKLAEYEARDKGQMKLIE